MGQQVRGVVAREKGAPVTLETIVVPDPGPGEAVVAVKACGVCHTDLHYREGGINDDFPFLLGHEAAGIVESVGPEVTGLAAGDFVVLNWRAVCGECRACRRGRVSCPRRECEVRQTGPGPRSLGEQATPRCCRR